MDKPNISQLDVPFTQFLRPDGRQRPVWIERSAEIAALARQLLAAGHQFEIEELMDHTVSMTVEAVDQNDPPIAIELCPNGPAVPNAVDRLIQAAASKVRN